MADFRALCAELLDWAEVTAAHYIQLPAVMLRARAALADEPAVPQGREPAAVTGQPSDGAVAELVEWLRVSAAGNDRIGATTAAAQLNRAAELLERLSPPQPVPVSERLPEPEDCDAEGRCWLGTPSFVNCYSVTQSAQWRLSAPDDRFGSEVFWLPAHALPLPEVGE